MKRRLTRRQALQEAAVGFGAMAVNSMLQQERLFAAESAIAKERIYDLKPKPPHFAAKAKRVIFIYIGGGPSTIDMFDPKPALMKYDGKPAPFEIKGRALNGSQQIMASPWEFTELRPERPPGLGAAAVLPEGGGQGDFRAVDDHGPNRPFHRAVHVRHRPRHYRIPDPRLLGQLRARHARTRICRRLSRWARAPPSATARTRPPGCLRSTTARRCAPIPSADLRHQPSGQHEPRSAAAAAGYDLGSEPRAEESVPAGSGSGVAHRQL